MPAGYAHYRFGRQLISELPPDVRQCVQRFRRLYDLGLHGPDIFFYHNPFLDTAAGRLAKQCHDMSGGELFRRGCACANTEGARAYLYGLLAHYCLDAACHPFINKAAADGTVGHIALEAEFDRFLMAMDGIAQPHRHDYTRHMKLTRGECVTVSGFYPGADGAAVSQSISFMGFALRFLAGGRRDRREKLLRKLKPGLCDFFIPEEPVSSWLRMDSELLARFNRARMHYGVLLEQLEAHRETGEPLGDEFLPNFSGSTQNGEIV